MENRRRRNEEPSFHNGKASITTDHSGTSGINEHLADTKRHTPMSKATDENSSDPENLPVYPSGDERLAETKKHTPVASSHDESVSSKGEHGTVNESHTPHQAGEEGDHPAVGKACRDCINFYYKIHLSRADCKYTMRDDGHRERGICEYCGMKRPIVKGLTMLGKVKAIGKGIS